MNIYVVGGAKGIPPFYKKPNFATDWNYLEAAPSDWNGENDPSQRWGNTGKTIKTDQAIGKGKSNTAEIIKEHPGDDNTAAKLCADYSIDKDGIPYDDWFLPSINELEEMYNNLKAQDIGGRGYPLSSTCSIIM